MGKISKSLVLFLSIFLTAPCFVLADPIPIGPIGPSYTTNQFIFSTILDIIFNFILVSLGFVIFRVFDKKIVVRMLPIVIGVTLVGVFVNYLVSSIIFDSMINFLIVGVIQIILLTILFPIFCSVSVKKAFLISLFAVFVGIVLGIIIQPYISWSQVGIPLSI
jgi:hypothetical protein